MKRRLFCYISLVLIGACAHDRQPCPLGSVCGPNPAPSESIGPVLGGSWGAQPGQFGVSDAEEGNAEAPMSLAYDPGAHELLVLDQVNLRIQVFRGATLKRVIPIPSGSVQDLALLANGNIVLLDRLRKGELVEIDREGTTLASTPATGDGIELAPEITGIFSNEKGIWAELGNQSILLLNASGVAPAQREIQPGFPAQNRIYKAQGTGTALSIVSAPTDQPNGQKQAYIHYPTPVTSIVTLRVDTHGKIYVGTRHLTDDGKSTSETLWVVVLNSELQEERRVSLPPRSGAREVFRELEIGPNGEIYYLHISADGAQVERY